MFTLPNLPYPRDALAPHISDRTMALHHDKHHKAYVDTLNELLEGRELADLPLVLVVHKTFGVPADKKIFNNAAQSWNHEFFWKSMKPQGGGEPSGAIVNHLAEAFGDAASFQSAFNAAAKAHFGSGWIWLTLSAGAITIMTTHDADLPPVHGQTALACCDLWEHAYYLDYQNRRPEFVQVFLDHLINWEFVNDNFSAATNTEK